MEATLFSVFGFTSFRDGQKEIIESVLSKENVLAVMPTGNGKSMLFQFPAAVLPGIVFVITPLIALMEDQVKNSKINAICLHSKLENSSKREGWKMLKNATDASSKLKLVYITPELLCSKGFAKESLAPLYKVNRISLFAIDEAHCISEWGHSFRPVYRKLGLEVFPKVPILALTATATLRVYYFIIIKF